MIDGSGAGTSSKLGAGGAMSKPITSGDPLLATGELREVLGGTPKVLRKAPGRRTNS